MLLAEDLLLLAHDDDTGFRTAAETIELALAGSMVIELAMRGRVDVVEDDEAGGGYRLEVVDRTPTGHALLDEWLIKIVQVTPAKPKDAVLAVTGNLSGRLLAGLHERGILQRRPGQLPGFIPLARWSPDDAHHERALLERLRQVLVEGRNPDERTAALVSVLTAIDGVPRVPGDVDRAGIAARAKEIAEGHPTSGTARRAVEEITAVVMLSIMVPTLVASAGS